MLACLRLPYFAASVEARMHAELAGQPLALVGPDATVVFVSAEAAVSGVQGGMSVQQARAQCSELVLRPAIHSHYQDELDALLAGLTLFTPQVEVEEGVELRADGRTSRHIPMLHASQLDDAPAATLYLDLGNLKPSEAVEMANQVQAFARTRTGLAGKMGLSSGKFTSRVAATAVNVGDVLVVPQGQDASFLAPFAVSLLPIDGETLRQLDLLGLHTLGHIATLPVNALVERFGKVGRTMHRLANGRDTRAVSQYVAPPVERIHQQFDDPVSDWTRLDAALTTMVETVMQRLRGSDQMVRQVTLLLLLEDGTPYEQHTALRQPRNSVSYIQDVVSDLAHTLSISCGILEAEIVLRDVVPVEPLQLSLFERSSVPQSHLAEVLEDLIARYGQDQFFWVRAADRTARLAERRYRWEKADGE